MALKKAEYSCPAWETRDSLTSESVESTTLSLQSIDNIHGSDSLPLDVLRVGDSVADNILQKHLHVNRETSGI